MTNSLLERKEELVDEIDSIFDEYRDIFQPSAQNTVMPAVYQSHDFFEHDIKSKELVDQISHYEDSIAQVKSNIKTHEYNISILKDSKNQLLQDFKKYVEILNTPN